jgi:hypothetical protein
MVYPPMLALPCVPGAARPQKSCNSVGGVGSLMAMNRSPVKPQHPLQCQQPHAPLQRKEEGKPHAICKGYYSRHDGASMQYHRNNPMITTQTTQRGDLRAVSWSSFALRYAFAFTGVPDPSKSVLIQACSASTLQNNKHNLTAKAPDGSTTCA